MGRWGNISEIPSDKEIKESCKRTPKVKNMAIDISECSSHAIVITAFDDKKGAFYFRNSWGAHWGLKGDEVPGSKSEEIQGYGLISYKYFAKFAFGPILVLE